MTHGFRQGTSFTELQARPGVREAAAQLGDFADLNVFFPGEPYVDDGGTEEPGEEPRANGAEEPGVVVSPTAHIVATEQAVDMDAPRVD